MNLVKKFTEYLEKKCEQYKEKETNKDLDFTYNIAMHNKNLYLKCGAYAIKKVPYNTTVKEIIEMMEDIKKAEMELLTDKTI